jgi:hypothetical protein
MADTNSPRLDVYQIEPWVLAWEPVEAVAPAAASAAPPALHMPVAKNIIAQRPSHTSPLTQPGRDAPYRGSA